MMAEGGNIGERRSRAGRSGCASMTTAERCGDEMVCSRGADDGFVSAVFSDVRVCGWLCSILKGEEMMRIDVDGQHGFVELVDWMTVDPVKKITDAARVSYDKDGAHDPE
jgi:hypothetical protein